MALNLLTEIPLNKYLTDLVYQGGTVPTQPNAKGEFESPDYVEQHRDEIVKGILLQYLKLRLRQYVLTLDNEPAFVLVDKNRTDLPGWTEQTFARGENLYEFDGAKMSQKLLDEITMVRDFLYDEAGQYVDKRITLARHTKSKPTISYNFLKTTNEYDTFEKALAAAKHWHENMAAELEKRSKARDLLKKSLVGVEHVMDLSDGMAVYQLKTEEALDFESEYMGHCVGKGGYDAGVKDGKIQIYSIRDERGEPHVTFEVRDGKIKQCKGKSNAKPIKKYMTAIHEFVTRKQLDPENDLKNMDLIKVDGTLYNIHNLPKKLHVKGDLDIHGYDFEELPDLSKWEIDGNFDCSHNKLTSLKGSPQKVGGKFYCGSNQLTSLAYGPQEVHGSFDCSYNQLTSLDGIPKEVHGYFNCSGNKLTSLAGGLQKVDGGFDCRSNQLTSLDGGPKEVHGNFDCSDNQLTSLVGGPKEVVGNFNCSNNQLTSLDGGPKEVGGNFNCMSNKLTSLAGSPKSVGKSFDCSNNQ